MKIDLKFILNRFFLNKQESIIEEFSLVGTPNPKIIIAGNSHRTMLARNQTNPTNRIDSIAVLLETQGKYIEPNSDYWKKLEDNLNLSTDLVLIYRGNDFMIDFLVKDDYQVWLSENSKINFEKDYILNRSIVYSRYSNLFEELGLNELIDRFKSKSRKMWLHGTPPPKSDKCVLDNINIEPFFKNLSEIKGIDLELINISTRIEIWKIYQEILMEFANKNGIEFIQIPNEIMLNDTLRDEFSAPDATHYNEKCGKIILENITKVVNGTSI